jgi:hypothetical protein
MNQWLENMWNGRDQSDRDEEDVEDCVLNAVKRPLTVSLISLSIFRLCNFNNLFLHRMRN